MKILDSIELSEYVKERQAKQVRALRQAHNIFPHLVLLGAAPHDMIESIQTYSVDILIDVDVLRLDGDIAQTIEQLNADTNIHAISLRFADDVKQNTRDLVAPSKDIEGLSKGTFDPPTPLAINWLLAGYNIDLRGKKIIVVGEGREIVEPTIAMFQNSGYDITHTESIDAIVIHQAEIVIVGRVKPSSITSDMIQPDAVVVEVETGGLAPQVRDRHDLTITPEEIGLKPLIIASIIDNLLRAARMPV